MCLATDANLTADPGVASLVSAWSYTLVEIDQMKLIEEQNTFLLIVITL